MQQGVIIILTIISLSVVGVIGVCLHVRVNIGIGETITDQPE
jgi:hypothetical protein